jgi:hypothetical protein
MIMLHNMTKDREPGAKAGPEPWSNALQESAEAPGRAQGNAKDRSHGKGH